MLFDGDGMSGEFQHFCVGQAKSRLLFNWYGNIACGQSRFAASVNHFEGFAAQLTAQYGTVSVQIGGFVDVKLVRIDRALHYIFTQTISARDENGITEAGFGIQCKHDA